MNLLFNFGFFSPRSFLLLWVDSMLPFQGAEFLSLFLSQGAAHGLMICCHFVARYTSPLSKCFSSYITTLCTSIGVIFPQALP